MLFSSYYFLCFNVGVLCDFFIQVKARSFLMKEAIGPVVLEKRLSQMWFVSIDIMVYWTGIEIRGMVL